MKRYFLALLGLLAVGAVQADCKEDARVAVDFINQYVAYVRSGFDGIKQAPLKQWLQSNALVDPAFVRHWQAAEEECLRQDPEMGCGADIILSAQDVPDKGYRLLRCSPTPGFVQLQGVGGAAGEYVGFNVTVRLVQTPQGPKVVGAGIVNIPEAEQAD